MVYSIINIGLTAYTSAGHGRPAVIVLIVVYFFESVMFPTIFVMGTSDLGRHTRRGAGILIMGISGGAVFPPIQGAIADAYSTRISYLVPMVGFIFVLAYALYYWIQHGYKVRRVAPIVGVHVVPTAEHKRASIIISQETIDTIIGTQRRSSRVSQLTDTVNHASKSTSIPTAPKTFDTENTNQTAMPVIYF